MQRRNIFSLGLFRYSILFVCLITLLPANLHAQQATIFLSNNFGAHNEVFLDDSTWYFHTNDLLKQGIATANTSGWDLIRHTNFGKAEAPQQWSGIGWFGIWVRADSTLLGKKLALRINHDGASELFLDGRPIGGYGKVGHSRGQMQAIRAPRELIPVWFSDTLPHLLEVHYSNFIGVYPNFLGFQLSFGDYEQRAQKTDTTKLLLSYLPMFAAAQLILGLLHFLFFLFDRRQKRYAYFALFLLFMAINGFGVYQYYVTPFPWVQHLVDFITQACKVAIMFSAVFLMYLLNYEKVPRWRIAALLSISIIYIAFYIVNSWILPMEINDHFSIAYFLCIMDGLWSVAQVIRRRQKDSWLIGIGIGAVILVYFFAWADVFALWEYGSNAARLFVMGAGSLVLPICLSLYLALDFARTNQHLSQKLREVENLAAKTISQEAEKMELIAGEARRLEQIVEQRTAELKDKADKLLAIDSMKSRFFTNISHEFKTPLTLIINPAKELLRNPSSHQEQHLRLIINNAERLLQLINQLLDLSKAESGLMDVQPEPVNLVALLKSHINAYASLAVQKKITINFTSNVDVFWILLDRDKMDKMVLNLLSNALKFTDKGRIDIQLHRYEEQDQQRFTLTFRDSGKGIPTEKLPFIFARFYQADPSDTRSAEGTGIGLALVKELVELMDGQVWAESVPGLFTQMSIEMPYTETEALADEETATQNDALIMPVDEPLNVTATDEDIPLILLIEDHYELRRFISHSLTGKYRLIMAADGAQGIQLGLQNIPNLIITDLMMPNVSGYEVSTTLKKNEITSHIPIILLTAKADLDSRIQGIEAGADAYLAKPFDQRELLALIENLISMREQLRLRYSSGDTWLKQSIDLPSIEQDFITRIRQAVESRLDDESYGASQLAADIGLSRTQLHRKLKGLVGKAPGELIRIVRLQHAHYLLERRIATVSEVGYMVGFSSPASFSSSFSRHFGFAPSKVGKIPA